MAKVFFEKLSAQALVEGLEEYHAHAAKAAWVAQAAIRWMAARGEYPACHAWRLDAANAAALTGGEVARDGDGWSVVPRAAIQAVLRETRQVARAKARAADLGLAYWPALIDGHGVTPAAFVAAEAVMAPVHGLYGVDGGRGGWDSCGYWGVSPQAVADAWLKAGCRDTPKFRAMVRNSLYRSLAKKGDTLPFLTNLVRGSRWLNRHGEHLPWGVVASLARKAKAALGRLSAPLRWAALSGVNAPEGTARIRIRDLNWEAVKVAQRGSRAAQQFLPEVIRHQVEWVAAMPHLFNFRMTRESMGVMLGVSPRDVPMGTVETLLDGLHMTGDGGVWAAELWPRVQLARLFGRDLRALMQFVGERSLHDAGQFSLPPGRVNPAWGKLVLQAPSLAAYTAQFGMVEAALGRVPRDQAEFRAVMGEIPAASIGVLAREYKLDSRAEADYIRLFETPHKQFCGVPAPVELVTGEYSLRQLAADDPLQVLAGLAVNCCQHLHGAAASCARLAWTDGNAAIWGVFKGLRMVGQTFVWRSASGEGLVMDSVECLTGHEDRVGAMLTAAANTVLGRMGVTRVYVGNYNNGATRVVAPAAPVVATPAAGVKLSYTDATKARLVAEATMPAVPAATLRQVMAQAVTEAQAAVVPVVFNELLEDSGVFCEHCNAEVHPDCEICPSCGANIAEWVE